MYERVLPQLWMALPLDERAHLANVFSVEKTGVTEVRDNVVISDGYRYEDLFAITAQKMIDYVGSTETFPRLWELTCAKARFELHPPVGVIRGSEEVIDNTNNNAKKAKSK